MKIKIIRALKKDLKIPLSLLLIILTYFLININHKFIFLFIFSLLIFTNNLIRIYYKNTTDIIEYSIICFIDISYTLLASFDIKYLIVYLGMVSICIYLDFRKFSNEKKQYLVFEFITVYTLFKILLLISMAII